MRSRSLAAQHDAAVARRLELLTSELDAVREPGAGGDTRVRPAASWSPQGHTHIRAVPDLVEAEGADASEPPERPPSLVRLPGRHASRRSGSWMSVPEGLRGRISLGPGQVAVVAVLVAVGLAITCWWLVRGQGHEIAAPAAVSTQDAALATPVSGSGSAAPPSGPAASTSGAAGGARVVVDVSGKVRHPGIAVLHQGARVIDALHAAGGARPGVDLSGLNLARVLTDGEQVVVGQAAVATPGGPGAGGTTPTPGAPMVGLVNINTADETSLESLPEVGPVTAQAIITWRTQNGGFASVDQLLDVDGIGDATLAKLTPYVTI
jgi:competence protein ComEA